MSKICPITNKSTKVAGRYSNRVRATEFNPTGKVRRKANLQKKKVYIPELDKTINLKISTKAIKTINKNGAYKTLKKANLI
ncbi:MAG: 50S ribosomal protein L28 [Candidatus Pacebacteria bacterium]|nr:50S ribosomal protein L28 [Candidatus Paceibacterota bacterium]